MRHAIVFNTTKTLVISIFDLVDEVAASTIFEHAVMRTIVEMKRLTGSGFLMSIPGGYGGARQNGSAGKQRMP